MVVVTYELDQDAGWKWNGSWDASLGSFPTVTTIGQGAVYYVTVAGTVDGTTFLSGDLLVSRIDSPSTTTFTGNWIQIGPGSNPVAPYIQNAGGDTTVHTDETLGEDIIRMDAGGVGNIVTVASSLVTISQPLTVSSGTVTLSALTNAVDDGPTDVVMYPDGSGELQVGPVWKIADNDNDTTITVATTSVGDQDTITLSAAGVANLAVTSTGTTLTNAVTLASKSSATNDGATLSALYLDGSGVLKHGPINLANDLVFQGAWDASVGTFPGAGAAEAGWYYKVTVGGTVDSVVFDIGDTLFAEVDSASTITYAANWFKIDNSQADPTLIRDTDGDTRIQVEETADEDIIRFDANGVGDVVTVTSALATISLPLTVTGDVTASNYPNSRDDGVNLTGDALYVTAGGLLQYGELCNHRICDDDADTYVNVETSADVDNVQIYTGGIASATHNANGMTTALDIQITSSSKGLILEAPDGTNWRLTINDDGSLTATSGVADV
jgi:hypothetical protein